jgi:hypothetical protein
MCYYSLDDASNTRVHPAYLSAGASRGAFWHTDTAAYWEGGGKKEGRQGGLKPPTRRKDRGAGNGSGPPLLLLHGDGPNRGPPPQAPSITV